MLYHRQCSANMMLLKTYEDIVGCSGLPLWKSTQKLHSSLCAYDIVIYTESRISMKGMSVGAITFCDSFSKFAIVRLQKLV